MPGCKSVSWEAQMPPMTFMTQTTTPWYASCPPPRPPPPYPLPSYISLLKPVATCRGTFCCTSLVHVMAASGQMMSGRCQRHCIACIYHAALASCCVRQALLASTPAYLCQAFRSTFNVFFDTALASGESPLCKAGVHTCRRAIHLSRG